MKGVTLLEYQCINLQQTVCLESLHRCMISTLPIIVAALFLQVTPVCFCQLCVHYLVTMCCETGEVQTLDQCLVQLSETHLNCIS